jgi:hypothetical protein
MNHTHVGDRVFANGHHGAFVVMETNSDNQTVGGSICSVMLPPVTFAFQQRCFPTPIVQPHQREGGSGDWRIVECENYSGS